MSEELKATDGFVKTKEWPDPTGFMLEDPLFDKIWNVIKDWDINVPGAYQGYCGATGNHARAIYDALRAPTGRQFPFAKPRKWKSKNGPKIFKVVPWFQPIEEGSRFDFKGLLKDVMPELHDDIMKEFDVYSGLVLQIGWQMYSENNVWFCVPMAVQSEFEDVGEWTVTPEEEEQIKKQLEEMHNLTKKDKKTDENVPE